MTGTFARWLAAVAAAGLVAAGVSAVTTASAGATSATGAATQPGPSEVGNLLDYANTDFEGTIGNWVSVSNATLTDDTADSFLHNDSLLDRATVAGTSSFRISGSASAIKITVTPGAEYRVGAYFKPPGTAHETVRFSLGCHDSSGKFIGEVVGTSNNLLATTKWQYSEDDIAVPAGCAYVQGSPEVTLGGLPANVAVNMDEVIFAPYRAALIIGAKGQSRLVGKGYTAADWIETNWASATMTTFKIGPLQSDKEFYGGSSPVLPSRWSDPGNNCYEIEQAMKHEGLPSADWPACVINFEDFESEAKIQDYLTGLPAPQMVILVYHDEPERYTFSGCPGQPKSASSAINYVCRFDLESRYIRRAAAAVGDVPNVFVAMDSATSEYGPGGTGAGCHWIPPTKYTDFYLADHYDQNVLPAPHDTLPTEGSPGPGEDWSNWLSCVRGRNKPLGLAEYGLDCNNPVGPDQQVVTDEINADKRYLAAIRGASEPTIMWEYWYSDNGGDPGCLFTNKYGAITAWQSAETQNGGGYHS